MYYCTRPATRSPSVYRIVSQVPSAARNASFLSNNFFPRSAVSNDFAPFLRLFDDITAPFAPAYAHHARQQLAPFNPRFDVREVGANYELRGEVPGVANENLEVEFSDPQTLVIRGRAEREYSSGEPQAQQQTQTAAVTEGQDPAGAAEKEDNSDAASTYSTGSYQKPSVEDGEAAESSEAPKASSSANAVAEQQPAAAEEKKEPEPTYWVSERSSGSFQRVFKFPSRVDQDAVTASLKNGILSIVVPKAAEPEARRINIE